MAHLYLIYMLFIQIFNIAAKCGAKVPAVIVFGDSSVDSGNNNFIPTIARANFEPYGQDFPGRISTGRFSNGRIPPDFISEGMGLKPIVPAFLDPMYNISDFATGVCFASAGTGYDNATANVVKVIPLWKEVEYYKDYQMKLKGYLGEEKAKEIISEALYLISIGTNDFLENYYTLPERRSQFNIQQYQNFLIGLARNFIKQIYDLGARKMSLTGCPPMGCLPLERATNFKDPLKCVEKYDNIALEFNAKLGDLVKQLNKERYGIKIFYANPYPIFMQLITRPSLYGIEVTECGCCGTGAFEMSYLCNRHTPLICTDPSKYLFWDAFHPNEKANQIISDYLLVPLKAMFL